MSDINSIVHAMFEEKGFDGVEMYNTTYPASQDDGNTQTGSNKAGAPVLATGAENNFCKEEQLNCHPNSNGKPNLSLGDGKNYATFMNYSTGGAGKPNIIFNK